MSIQNDRHATESTADETTTVIDWNKLPKPPTVGIIGGGQLAQMMYQSTISLGIDAHLFSSPNDEAAPKYFKEITKASSEEWTPSEIYHFAQKCDVVTFDHELVPPNIVRELEKRGCLMLPTSATLELSANKANQRKRLSELGFTLPEHQICNTEGEILSFGSRVGWPLVIKPSTGGYDGRGVFIVEEPEETSKTLAEIATLAPLVVEPLLKLEGEGSVLVARSSSGECRSYPMVRTWQVDGMCREVTSPSGFSDDITKRAEELATQIASGLGVVGILAVEFFLVDGTLLVNELAPRPHNTGHITIEANVTSQFENHLRAILGLPLGDTSLRVPAAAMVNVISNSASKNLVKQLPHALAIEGANVHLYSKTPRKNRKIGHVTATASDVESALAIARISVDKLIGLDLELEPK